MPSSISRGVNRTLFLGASIDTFVGLREHSGSAVSSSVRGTAFTAYVGYEKVTVWLPLEQRRRIVRTSNIRSVTIEPNGYTRLALTMRKDLIVPTTHREALELVKRLNTVISERSLVEHRRRLAGEESRTRSKVPYEPF